LELGSGELARQHDGSRAGERSVQSVLAEHDVGVDVPGLTVDAMDWELGSDRASSCVESTVGHACCE